MPDAFSVVSGSTETTGETPVESSTTDTQTTETTVETPVAETPTPEPTDWRAKQREDATLNAHIQSEIARVRARDDRRALRTQAKTAVDSENVDSALEIARRIASEPDEQDEDTIRDAAWSSKADKVQPHLERMLRLNNGQATDPDYIALYKREGQSAMDKRYDADPEAFVDWAEKEIFSMRVTAAVQKIVPSLTKGIKSDAENAAMAHLPTPLSGGTGGSGAITHSQYNSDPELRAKLRSTEAGRRQIDEMMARG